MTIKPNPQTPPTVGYYQVSLHNLACFKFQIDIRIARIPMSSYLHQWGEWSCKDDELLEMFLKRVANELWTSLDYLDLPKRKSVIECAKENNIPINTEAIQLISSEYDYPDLTDFTVEEFQYEEGQTISEEWFSFCDEEVAP